jgi:hypothetical protein
MILMMIGRHYLRSYEGKNNTKSPVAQRDFLYYFFLLKKSLRVIPRKQELSINTKKLYKIKLPTQYLLLSFQ